MKPAAVPMWDTTVERPLRLLRPTGPRRPISLTPPLRAHHCPNAPTARRQAARAVPMVALSSRDPPCAVLAEAALLLLAASGILLRLWWRRRHSLQTQDAFLLCSVSAYDDRTDRGLNLLSRTSRLVPQSLVVGTAKAVWRFIWERMLTELAPRDDGGGYQRPKAAFDGCIGSESHPVESGRYHVYLGNPCPWCHRVALLVAFKGLETEGHVTTSLLLDDPLKASRGGWAFSPERPDPVHGAKDLWEVYDRLSPGYVGRCTAPLLIDRRSNTVVSNESEAIVRMLAAARFGDSPKGRRDLRPTALAPLIDETNEWVYRQLNNGVYRCGFATTQAAYDTAAAEVRAGLRRADALLATQPFLCGDHVTEADIRLLPTAVRFDAVYAPFFKAGGVHLRIRDYPALFAWMQRCWALDDLRSTYDLPDAQGSYYRQLFPLSPGSIVPTPPTLEDIGLSPPDPTSDSDRFFLLLQSHG
jgi:putative glutathione S-transferase